MFQKLLALDGLAEDHVLSVEPRARDEGQEELAAVGVLASVGHGEESWLGVLVGEVLVVELFAVDGFTSGT